MDTLFIRQAEQKDIYQIQDILIKSQWFTYEEIFSAANIQKIIDCYYNLERLREEIATINAGWHGYIVAEEAGRIIGVIGGGMRNTREGEVYVLYLHPEKLGQGIGTELLSYFTNIQKDLYGAEVQWVAVAKGNNYGIPFYEARGFIFEYANRSYAALDENDISLWYRRRI